MPFEFEKFILSPRQKHIVNKDRQWGWWPEIFLWTEGLILLDSTKRMLEELPKMSPEDQALYQDGQIPKEWLRFLPDRLARTSPKQILEYCRAWQSQKHGESMVMIKIRGDKLDPNGTLRMGAMRFDEETWALNLAGHSKDISRWPIPRVIERAAERNDVRFFMRLGRILQSKAKRPDVDWNRCPLLIRFLVYNWCEAAEYQRGMPVLCQFTDQALADFCSVVMDRKPGNPSAESIRKWKLRLGLKSVSSPKIRKFKLIGNEFLFE